MEMSRAKTIFALAIVVGCFAILWPKIFYPMLLTSVAPPQKHHQTTSGFCCGVVFESDASVQFMAELCSWVLKNDMAMELTTLPLERGGRPPENVVTLCRQELLTKCNVDINDVVRSDVDGVVDRRRKLQGLRANNLTNCLKIHFDIDEESLLAKKSYPQHPIFIPRHMKPERPPHLHPDLMHPALREKGRVLPPRIPEKQTKPGPVPGMRPPMGGPGHIVPPSRTDSTGSMGILMPIYTVGIVVFFVYTIMKIMFKKSEDQKPLIKDFHLDPEQRKFIFAEEYTTGGELSMKDYIRRQEKLDQLRRSRSKSPVVVQQQEKLEEEEIKEELQQEVKQEAKQEVAEKVKEEAKEEVNEEVKEELKEETKEQQEEEVEETPVEETIFVEEQSEKLTSKKEDETVEDVAQPSNEPITIHKMDTGDRDLEEEEIDQLRRRLEETEKAMERIVAQMENVADRLSVTPPEKLNQTTTLRQNKEDAAGEEEEECIDDKEVEPEVNEIVATEEELPAVKFTHPESEEGQLSESEPISRAIEEFSELTADKLISEVLISKTLLEKGLDTCVSEPDEEVPREEDDRLRRSSSRQSSDDAKLTVMGMEVTVGLEGGKKMSRSPTPVKDLLPKPEKIKVEQPLEYVPSVFLEAALPPDTHLVVSEAECRAEAVPIEQLDLDEMEYETTPVVLSGKMTLSVIGMELVADPATQEESSYEIPERTRPGILREQPSEEDFESPSRGHRVRFMTEPEEVIIPPSDEFELEDYAPSETVFDDKNAAADNDTNESTELLETPASVLVPYRPPTPPIHYEHEQEATEESENEFLTYTELEEAGEVSAEVVVDIPIEQEEAEKSAKLQEEEEEEKPAKLQEEEEEETERKEETFVVEDDPVISKEPESNIDSELLEEIEQDIVAEVEVNRAVPEKETESAETRNRNEEVETESQITEEEPDELPRKVESETIAVSEEMQSVDEIPQQAAYTHEARNDVENISLQVEEKDQLDIVRKAETTETEAVNELKTVAAEASLIAEQAATSEEHQYEEGTSIETLQAVDVTEDREVTQAMTGSTPGIATDSMSENNLEVETESLENAAVEEVLSESTVEPETEVAETVYPEDTKLQESTLDTAEEAKLESCLETEGETFKAITVEDTSSEPAVEPETDLVETAYREYAKPLEVTSIAAEDAKQESSLETETETLETVGVEDISPEFVAENKENLVKTLHTENAEVQESTLDVSEDVQQESSLEVESETSEPVAPEVSSEPAEEAELVETAYPEDAEPLEVASDVTEEVKPESNLEMQACSDESAPEEISSEPVLIVDAESGFIETIRSETLPQEEAEIKTDLVPSMYESESHLPQDEEVVTEQEIIIDDTEHSSVEMGFASSDTIAEASPETKLVTPSQEDNANETVSSIGLQSGNKEEIEVAVETISTDEGITPEDSESKAAPVEEETRIQEIILTASQETAEEAEEPTQSVDIESSNLDELEIRIDTEETAVLQQLEETADGNDERESNDCILVAASSTNNEFTAQDESTPESADTSSQLAAEIISEETDLQTVGAAPQHFAEYQTGNQLGETASADGTCLETGPEVEDQVVSQQDTVTEIPDVVQESTYPEETVESEESFSQKQAETTGELLESRAEVAEEPLIKTDSDIGYSASEETCATDAEPVLCSETSGDTAETLEAEEVGTTELESKVSDKEPITSGDETVADPEEAKEEVVIETSSANETTDTTEVARLEESKQINPPPAYEECTPEASRNVSDVEETIEVSEFTESDPDLTADRELQSNQQEESLEEVTLQEMVDDQTKNFVAGDLQPAEKLEEKLAEVDPSIAEAEPREVEEELAFEVIDKSEIAAMDHAEVSLQASETTPSDEHEVVLEDPLKGSHDGPDNGTDDNELAQPSRDEGFYAVDNQLENKVVEEEKNTVYEQTDNNLVDNSVKDGSYSPDSLEPVKDLAEPEQQTNEQEIEDQQAELEPLATDVPSAEAEKDLSTEQPLSTYESSTELETRAQGTLTEESSQQLAADSEVPTVPEVAVCTIFSPNEETAQRDVDLQGPPEQFEINEEGVLQTEQQQEITEHKNAFQEAEVVIEPVPTHEIHPETTLKANSPDSFDDANIDRDVNLEMTEETVTGRDREVSKAEEENLIIRSAEITNEQESEVAETKENIQQAVLELEPVVDDTEGPITTPVLPENSDTVNNNLEPTLQGSDREDGSVSGLTTEDAAEAVHSNDITDNVITEGDTVSMEDQPEKAIEVSSKIGDEDAGSVDIFKKEGTSTVEEQNSTTDRTENVEETSVDDANVVKPVVSDSNLTELDCQDTTDAAEPHRAQSEEETKLPPDGTSSEGAEQDVTIAQTPAEETNDTHSSLEVKEPITDSKSPMEDYPDESEITSFQPKPVPDIPDSLLMEIEAQIVPSESYLLGSTYERDSVAVHIPYLHQYESTEEPVVEPLCQEYIDYQRDREVEEMEHTLETLPASSSQREGQEDASGSERKASVKSEAEEPVISQFVIREDYPDDGVDAGEDDVPLTEEDILQARKEIDEIRKLLAHVSYTEGDYAADDSCSEEAQSTPEENPRNAETQKSKEDLESQLAHAMLEEEPILASSKGSSPDMEEYEVVGNSQKVSPVTEQATAEAQKSSGAAPFRSGVLEHPSPLTPTTEASFERINATEQNESESQ